jgi:glycosyltransferase involved in cell wall biosynthesis
MAVGLLTADVEGWAFDINNDDMIEYCSSKNLRFEKHYYGSLTLPVHWDYDFVFCPWHRRLSFYGARTLLGALRSDWFDGGNRVPPTDKDKQLVSMCAGFQVVTRKVFDELSKSCMNISYLTNPVNMRRFKKAVQPRKEIICCWNGNAQHWSGNTTEVKGLYSILLPATSTAEVKFVIAEYNTCRLDPVSMPFWYQRANVALCASLFEGASNSTMEAMASGLALITTDCGNHREIQESQLKHLGDTGIIIVERNAPAFVDAICKLTPKRAYEMGRINRQEIQERWSWDFWRDDFVKFFRLAL